MLNGLVLICATCGNTDLDFSYIDYIPDAPGNGGVYYLYCPKCENMGKVTGFTTGPIRLRAEKVLEIRGKMVKPPRVTEIGVKTTDTGANPDSNSEQKRVITNRKIGLNDYY